MATPTELLMESLLRHKPVLLRQVREEMKQGRDSLGRRYCTDSGKRVNCPGGDAGGPSESGSGSGSGSGGQGKAGALYNRLTAAAPADSRTKKALKGTARLATGIYHAVHHSLTAPGNATRALCDEIVKAQAAKHGATPDEVAAASKKMQRIVGLADAAFSWLAAIPTASGLIHGAHLGIGTAGEVALAKLAFYVPVASLAFVAGSAVADPMGTIRAARSLIKGGVTHESLMEAEQNPPTEEEARAAMARLADGLLRAGAESDWYEALVAVALDESKGDLGRAVEMADAAFAKQPTNPNAGGA